MKTDTISNYIHSFILIALESDCIVKLAVFKKLSHFNESIVDSYPTTRQLES